MPLVSVVLPVYNREKVLARAIRSVLAQTFTDWEMVIVDDGSKDNSAPVAREFASADPRIRVVQFEKNKGANEARNTGVRESTAPWIAMLDSDDEWTPERLQKQFDVIEQWKRDGRGEPGWIYGWSEIRNLDGSSSIDRRGCEGDAYAHLLRQPFGWTSSLLFRREVFDKVGGFDSRYWENCDEYDLALRASKETSFAAVKEVICIVHRSPDSKFDPAAYARIIRRNRPEIDKHCTRREIGQIYCGLAASFYANRRYATGLYYFIVCLRHCPKSSTAWRGIAHYPKHQLRKWFGGFGRTTSLDELDSRAPSAPRQS